MGLTGLEPVTLRLSSACSNQLSYRPEEKMLNAGIERHRRQPQSVRGVVGAHGVLGAITGGKGIRTPDL
jgi:hypothetical protein